MIEVIFTYFNPIFVIIIILILKMMIIITIIIIIMKINEVYEASCCFLNGNNIKAWFL